MIEIGAATRGRLQMDLILNESEGTRTNSDDDCLVRLYESTYRSPFDLGILQSILASV